MPGKERKETAVSGKDPLSLPRKKRHVVNKKPVFLESRHGADRRRGARKPAFGEFKTLIFEMQASRRQETRGQRDFTQSPPP